MTAFLFTTFFLLLTLVYVAFLLRMRSGIATLHYAYTRTSAIEVDADALPSVTVVVPVRNEQLTIVACIASLKAQIYPADRCQFIIVDDYSEDETVELAGKAIEGDRRFVLLRLAEIPNSSEGKKAAITLAIEHAVGDVVITTDADCSRTPMWVRSMANAMSAGADVVAGPIVIEGTRTLSQRMQALEFLGLVGVGAGFFGIGFPRMCNGANFAYRKDAFRRAGGFAGHENSASGDDEFLLHKIVYELNGTYAFNLSVDALVSTPPVPTLGGFLRQRIRWASKGLQYDDRRFSAFLVLLFAYFCFCAAAPIIMLLSPFTFMAVSFLLILKFITEAAVLTSAAEAFKQKIRWTDFVIAEVFHPYYLIAVSVFGTLGPIQWKNRKLKK